jgi:inactivated superfamily I helicase
MLARRLNHVENIAQQDAAERALNKLARTFAAQMDTLKRIARRGSRWCGWRPYLAAMLRWLISRLDARRAPMLEAERIVHQQDLAELLRLAAQAADPDQSFEVRRYNARILRIAIARQELSRGVDRRTRDRLYERWEGRRGSLTL